MALLAEPLHDIENPAGQVGQWDIIYGDVSPTGQPMTPARNVSDMVSSDWHWLADVTPLPPRRIGAQAHEVALIQATGEPLGFEHGGTAIRYWTDVTRSLRDVVQERSLDGLKIVNPVCAERIQLLSELQPNWDGYGAGTISAAAVQRSANLLLNTLQRNYRAAEKLFIAPLANGGIELEWDWPSGNELMLVIPPDGQRLEVLATILEQPSGEETEYEGEIPNENVLEKLLDLLST